MYRTGTTSSLVTVWLFLMRSLQVYSGKEFIYYMVPHRSYDFSFIRRTRPPGGKSISKMYEYPTPNDHPPPAPLPCSALGPLKSHVYPHYVIANAALKFKKDPNNFDILGIMKDQEGQNIKTERDAEVLESRITELFDIWTAGYDAKPPSPADEYVEPSNGAGPSRSRDKRPRKSHHTGSYAESSDASQDDEFDHSGDGGESDGDDDPREGFSDYDDEEEEKDNLGMTPDRGSTRPSVSLAEISPIRHAMSSAVKPDLIEGLDGSYMAAPLTQHSSGYVAVNFTPEPCPLEGPDGPYMAISLTESSSGDSTGSSEPGPRPLEGYKIPYAAPRIVDWVKASTRALEEQKASTIRCQSRFELTRTLIGVYGQGPRDP
jgi:hypothetical protein